MILRDSRPRASSIGRLGGDPRRRFAALTPRGLSPRVPGDFVRVGADPGSNGMRRSTCRCLAKAGKTGAAYGLRAGQSLYKTRGGSPFFSPRRHPRPVLNLDHKGDGLPGGKRGRQRPQFPVPGGHFRNLTRLLSRSLMRYRGQPSVSGPRHVLNSSTRNCGQRPVTLSTRCMGHTPKPAPPRRTCPPPQRTTAGSRVRECSW